MDLRVAIVEDDPEFRASMETLLSHAPGFRLAGSFANAADALAIARRTSRDGGAAPWDLTLMDLALPGMDGIQATRHLKEIWPQHPVVALTAFEEPATILEAICSGADGYLVKRTSARELLAQLQAIATGGSPLSAGVARSVPDLLRRGEARRPGATETRLVTRMGLSEREMQVLRCLVAGQGYKQAASELGISVDTVRTHIRAVYRKLQVHSVAEAVVRAIRDRLV